MIYQCLQKTALGQSTNDQKWDLMIIWKASTIQASVVFQWPWAYLDEVKIGFYFPYHSGFLCARWRHHYPIVYPIPSSRSPMSVMTLQMTLCLPMATMELESPRSSKSWFSPMFVSWHDMSHVETSSLSNWYKKAKWYWKGIFVHCQFQIQGGLMMRGVVQRCPQPPMRFVELTTDIKVIAQLTYKYKGYCWTNMLQAYRSSRFYGNQGCLGLSLIHISEPTRPY